MVLRVILIAFLVASGATCAAPLQQFGSEVPLSEGQSYVWQVRPWHSHQLWVPADDSVDVALLRDRCGVPAGHGLKGCYSEEDFTVAVSWKTKNSSIAEAVPIPRVGWRFGPSSGNARVRGLRPGVTLLIVAVPQGAFYDTITVLPAFDRLRIEPRDSVYFAGDTIWFRVQGLDRMGNQVVALPWPFSFGREVGPAKAGAIPIVFDYVQPGVVPTNAMDITIGSKSDTMRFRVARRPSAP